MGLNRAAESQTHPGAPAAAALSLPTGSGEGRHPKTQRKDRDDMRRASERCIRSVWTSPGLFSQKNCPRCLCCPRTRNSRRIPSGRAGRQRQAAPRGLFVSRHPDWVLPALPRATESCSSHTPAREPISRQEGSERPAGAVLAGHGQAACGGEVRPTGQRQAAPRLLLPSELSRGCGPALGPGLRAELERKGQGHTERSLSREAGCCLRPPGGSCLPWCHKSHAAACWQEQGHEGHAHLAARGRPAHQTGRVDAEHQSPHLALHSLGEGNSNAFP